MEMKKQCNSHTAQEAPQSSAIILEFRPRIARAVEPDKPHIIPGSEHWPKNGYAHGDLAPDNIHRYCRRLDTFCVAGPDCSLNCGRRR
jgi:hypothetical protein